MKYFDRLRRRLPPATTVWKVRDEPGPLTAHEAWAIVRPVARKLDDQPGLTLVTSGLDVSREGRSFTWEFGFDLPGRRARVLFSVEPSGEAEAVDQAPVALVQRITAAQGAAQRPTLPERFRDSPGVVAELEAAGVDFVAGPSDMKLEARIRADGRAVWLTYYWDEERAVPFAAVE